MENMANIYLALAIGGGAWLGFLSAKYKKTTRVLIWLSLPIAWMMYKILPKFITVLGSKRDMLSYYVSLYEGLSEFERLTFHTFILVFVVMRILAWLYIAWFVEGRVETIRERKARILKFYKIKPDEMNW